MLPVRDPWECAVIVPGVSRDQCQLWTHYAMPFGAVGSVWGYIRVADVLAFLPIASLWPCVAHFVDDFFLVKGSGTAHPAFRAFQSFHQTLGSRMKQIKAKPPGRSHTLFGVEWDISDIRSDRLLASPGKRRISKLAVRIEEALRTNTISAADCASLSGKLMFVCSWVFGHVGKAFLQPLYFRQRHGPAGRTTLSEPLRAALRHLRALLPSLRPVSFPLGQHIRARRVCVLYADAFITLRDACRAAARWLPDAVPFEILREATNGFGAVFCALGSQPIAFRGEVPRLVLARVASSKAFIFWLEALAQILSIIVVAHMVEADILCFVDNTAAELALRKGSSKDLLLSALIGQFWIWVAERGLCLHFRRVASSENLSDGISRGDLADVQDIKGRVVEVPFIKIWQTLLQLEPFGDRNKEVFDVLASQLFELVAAGALEGGMVAR